MNKDFLIQLTNNLYRLTLFFPKKEPLRYKMRELADEILANSLRITNKTENRSPRILEDLEVLDSFFEVAKNQNWVSPSDILEIQKEYCKMREGLKQLSEVGTPKVEKESETAKAEPREIPVPDRISGASSRQEKILEILKEKGKAQVWEFKEIFPEVTKRTLRRDFERLLNQGLIERIGERNETFYLPASLSSARRVGQLKPR